MDKDILFISSSNSASIVNLSCEDSDTSVWLGTVENAPSEITITEVAFLELPIFSVLILSMGSCITEILSPYKDA